MLSIHWVFDPIQFTWQYTHKKKQNIERIQLNASNVIGNFGCGEEFVCRRFFFLSF